MRLDVKVPYMARVRRGKAFRNEFVLATLPCEVREATASDCPVVASYPGRTPGNATVYRSVGAMTGKRLRRPAGFRTCSEWLSVSASEPWREAGITLGRWRVNGPCSDEDAVETRPALGDVPSREACVAKAAAAVGDLTLVDGEAWVRCQGPILEVLGGHEPRVVVTEPPPPGPPWDHRLGLFRLDQAEAALRYAKDASPEYAHRARVLDFELVDASLLDDRDLQAEGLLHAASMIRDAGDALIWTDEPDARYRAVVDLLDRDAPAPADLVAAIGAYQADVARHHAATVAYRATMATANLALMAYRVAEETRLSLASEDEDEATLLAGP